MPSGLCRLPLRARKDAQHRGHHVIESLQTKCARQVAVTVVQQGSRAGSDERPAAGLPTDSPCPVVGTGGGTTALLRGTQLILHHADLHSCYQYQGV